uniref:(California timema) hypothetical protein n=1 Tax=Timema californicum TaxID=61474 RepID=A0A7R9P9G5_TIMCA|nr:unnamed protein product [Timema californicum]
MKVGTVLILLHKNSMTWDVKPRTHWTITCGRAERNVLQLLRHCARKERLKPSDPSNSQTHQDWLQKPAALYSNLMASLVLTDNLQLTSDSQHLGDVQPCYFCGLETPYSCHPKCREKTSSGDPKPFSCHICNGKFKAKRTLERHLNLHLPDSPFCCDICGKLSTTKSSLSKHRTIHFGEYHQCNICFKIFSRKDVLNIHVITHRSNKTRKDFLCEICGYLCNCFHLLKEHISNVHSHERKYICEVCGAGTNKINKFKDHMVSHTGDKQFICAVCDKPFGIRGNLKIHIMRCHPKTMGLSKKTFPCSLCDKVYQSMNGIIKHMRSHTGERNFVCDLCGKHFMHPFDLSKHKKSSIHNEELAAQQKSKRINKNKQQFKKPIK